MSNTRDLGISGGNGKGDADRSPGWRQHYDEIEWDVCDIFHPDDPNVKRKGGRIIKRYGPAAPRKLGDV
jgi:hypothetical protein